MVGNQRAVAALFAAERSVADFNAILSASTSKELVNKIATKISETSDEIPFFFYKTSFVSICQTVRMKIWKIFFINDGGFEKKM